QPPAPIDTSGEAENGRGLMLVEAISRKWGWYFRDDSGGKFVWAGVTKGRTRRHQSRGPRGAGSPGRSGDGRGGRPAPPPPLRFPPAAAGAGRQGGADHGAWR